LKKKPSDGIKQHVVESKEESDEGSVNSMVVGEDEHEEAFMKNINLEDDSEQKNTKNEKSDNEDNNSVNSMVVGEDEHEEAFMKDINLEDDDPPDSAEQSKSAKSKNEIPKSSTNKKSNSNNNTLSPNNQNKKQQQIENDYVTTTQLKLVLKDFLLDLKKELQNK